MKTKNGNLPGSAVTSLACSVCTPEQLKSLNSNVATKLAFRYLRPVDEHDREDAFDGLVALCWKARGNLCILPTWSEQAEGKTECVCTREFVEDFVLGYFERYEGQTEQQILAAALGSKFRYIGHALKGKMIDEIRRRTALKNQEPYCQSLAPGVEALLPDYESTADYASTLSDLTPRHITSGTPMDFIRARETTLTKALGEKNYEVLEAQAEVFPAAFQGSDQAGKSALTRAIARRRAVSEVQARTDKRELLAKVSEEMRRGNGDLIDLHAFLARGDDEHTLREIHISSDGRRKRSIMFRIVLTDKKRSL